MESPVSDTPETKLHHAERYGWRGFITLGLAFLVLGVAAVMHIQVAAMISTFVIGILVIAGGILALVLATYVHDRETRPFWLIGASLYLIVGAATLAEPFMGEQLLCLIAGTGLSLAGLSRLVAGARLRSRPVLVSATVTIIVAIAVAVDWGDNLLWILGYAMAGDFAAQGLATIVAGEQLHRAVAPRVR